MFANFANSRAPPIRNHQNFEKWDVSLWDSMITGKTWEEKHVFWGFNRKKHWTSLISKKHMLDAGKTNSSGWPWNWESQFWPKNSLYHFECLNGNVTITNTAIQLLTSFDHIFGRVGAWTNELEQFGHCGGVCCAACGAKVCHLFEHLFHVSSGEERWSDRIGIAPCVRLHVLIWFLHAAWLPVRLWSRDLVTPPGAGAIDLDVQWFKS